MENGLRVTYQNAIWVTLDGKRCIVPDTATDTQLFGFDKKISPPTADFGALPIGPEVSIGACFVQAEGQTAVYLLNNNQKRHLERVCGDFSLRNMESLQYPYILLAISTGAGIP